MTRNAHPTGSRRARLLLASLLTGTILAGGVAAWSWSGQATAAVKPESLRPAAA
jgi:hypothetical protein